MLINELLFIAYLAIITSVILIIAVVALHKVDTVF
jgi:hypothetical protein